MSDQFASRIENKRHLCSMLDRIVIGAQRLAKEIEDGSSSSSSSGVDGENGSVRVK